MSAETATASNSHDHSRTSGNLLDYLRHHPAGNGAVAFRFQRNGYGNVWRAAESSAGSLHDDERIPYRVCRDYRALGALRHAGNSGWPGDDGRRAIRKKHNYPGSAAIAFGNSAGNNAGSLYVGRSAAAIADKLSERA